MLLCIGLVIVPVAVLSCVHCFGTFLGSSACKHAMQCKLSGNYSPTKDAMCALALSVDAEELFKSGRHHIVAY